MLNTEKGSKLNIQWTYITNFDRHPTEKEGFLMFAKRNIKKGEELFTAYGSKSSYHFYMYYGFILNDELGVNKEKDFVPILVELKPDDPNYKGKLKILTLNKQEIDKEFRVTASIYEHECKQLIMWSRLIAFKGDIKLLNKKMGTYIAQDYDDALVVNPISIENEIDTLKLI